MSGASREPYAEVGTAARHVLARAAAADPPLRPRAWRVLAAVLSMTVTWSRMSDGASHDHLGTVAGLDMSRDHNRRNLSRELHALAAAGLITYRPGSAPKGKPRQRSIVGIPRPPVGTDPLSDPLTPGRDRPPVGIDPRSTPTPGTPGRTRPGVPPVGTDPPSEKGTEKGSEKLFLPSASADGTADQGPTFEAFWTAYPRHHETGAIAGGGAKKPARDRWAKLTPAEREAAMVGVAHYRADVEARGQIVKHPEGWLKQRRWEDLQEPVPPPVRRGRPAHARSDVDDAHRHDPDYWTRRGRRADSA